MNPVADKNNGRIWPVALAVVVASLIFALLVTKMRQYVPSAAPDKARKEERAKALAELRAAEADALQNPGWIDQTKGLVRLPIADAMKQAERAWQNPAQARSNLIARLEKATALPPKPPEQPSPFE
jgi:hypothetical protein